MHFHRFICVCKSIGKKGNKMVKNIIAIVLGVIALVVGVIAWWTENHGFPGDNDVSGSASKHSDITPEDTTTK